MNPNREEALFALVPEKPAVIHNCQFGTNFVTEITDHSDDKLRNVVKNFDEVEKVVLIGPL